MGLGGARNLVDEHVGKGLRYSPHAKYAARAVSRTRGGLPTNEPNARKLALTRRNNATDIYGQLHPAPAWPRLI
jgi:hypothetical protein